MTVASMRTVTCKNPKCKITFITRRPEKSTALPNVQLDVEKGLQPQSIGSLLAKGYVKIEERNDQRRHVITEAGRSRRGY